MRKHKVRKMMVLGIGLVAGLLLAACAPQVVEKPVPATVIVEKPVPATVIVEKAGPSAQVVQVAAPPAAVVPAGARTKWDTDESIRGGLRLVATYDSSGPNAWDPVKHPMVYYSSEGAAKTGSPGNNKLPGLYVIDAYTKEVIASALFKLDSGTDGQPHTVGISPDGKWLYIAGGNTGVPDKLERTLIINARTLKLDTVLGLPGSKGSDPEYAKRLHHVSGFKDWQGRDRVVLTNGFGAVAGPHFVIDPKDNNRVVTAITADDVRPMGHPYPAPDPTGKILYISLDSPEISEAESRVAGIAKFDLETGKVVAIISGVGNHPIGICHTSDGKFTYVVDGKNSLVFKIDNATNKNLGSTSAGVVGPYGCRLNWDETQLWTVGKGEGSHNTGGVLGVIDTKIFKATREFNQPIALGGSASAIDHAILHPDPKVNEFWISNMNGWETIVLDLNTRKVKAYIATPHGGDTHSGGFVRYNPDFTGELLIDMGGPQKAMFATMLSMAKAAAAK